MSTCDDKNSNRSPQHSSSQTVESVLTVEYWKSLCSNLTIKEQTENSLQNFTWPEKSVLETKLRIQQDGYTKLDEQALNWNPETKDNFDKIRTAVEQLSQQGWPASFLLVFDQVWQVIAHAEQLMIQSTGNRCNFDVLAWYVDPNKDDAGFAPHRDRQPDDAASTFREDGTPKYSTCWIPFTDACPDNSCLHFIPAGDDPGYMSGDLEGENDPDPLQRSLPNKEAFQNIKCVPVETGGAVVFTHRVIHWGSKGRKGYPTPRISMSFGCAADDYEKAYLDRKHLPYPPLGLRVALACAQMISYYQRFAPSEQQLQLYYQVFDKFKEEFDSEYRQRIVQEYVKACDEMHIGEQDEMLDGALETMLQQGGDGYQDDFDSLDEEGDPELGTSEGAALETNGRHDQPGEEEDEDEETIAALGLSEEEFIQLVGRPPKRAKKQ